MKGKYLTLAVVAAGFILYVTACDNNLSPDIEDSIQLFSGLEQIPEASNTKVVINHGEKSGSDSYFHFKIEGAEPNLFIQNGDYEGWCLEWEKPLRSNNHTHDGIKWYSTATNDKWRPLNYLFHIRNELIANDPELTYKDIQAVVWTLTGYMGISSEFDVFKLSDSELPSRLLSDGRADFSRDKVKSIAERVIREYADRSMMLSVSGGVETFGVVGETGGEEQSVFIPGVPLDPCRDEVAESGNVDVMLLFDDTGSFVSQVRSLQTLLPALILNLESDFPDIDFGFGVSRFEDYGGPGTGFSFEVAQGRPFILNQPIVTIEDAGGLEARNTLIEEALSRSGAGFGGDAPETPLHALYELATGLGFDGNGDGSTAGSGAAGSFEAQTSPGTSGDVPAFATNVLPASGTLGGAGWRADAQKVVILATDVCPVSAFDVNEGIPPVITGQGGLELNVSYFACSSLTPGSSRFGFVSDAKSTSENTISGAVAPSGTPTVQETVDALTSLGIQVVGLSTGSATTSSGPSFNPWVFETALARLTGAVDEEGTPFVFPLSTSPAEFTEAIVGAIGASVCDPAETTTAAMRFSRYAGMSLSSDYDTSKVNNYVIFD